MPENTRAIANDTLDGAIASVHAVAASVIANDAELEKERRECFERCVETTCRELADLLKKKNAAYGSAASRKPFLLPNVSSETAIFVRMSDKIARLRSLLSGENENDEPLSDTIRDLAGYCVLYLASHR